MQISPFDQRSNLEKRTTASSLGKIYSSSEISQVCEIFNG
jgi:hypothetical protein